jgi:hypothetical protein
LSFPSNTLETDHKENMSCGVYRVFPSGFTISIYYFKYPIFWTIIKEMEVTGGGPRRKIKFNIVMT